MNEFLSYVVSGAITGCVYSLLGMGLVLTYMTTKTLNLAQGAFAFVGAYLFFELNTALGLPPALAAVIVVLVFAPLMGLLIEGAVMQHLDEASDAQRLLATVGLLVAIPAAFTFIVNELIKAGVGLASNQFALSVTGLGPAPKKIWDISGSLVVDSDQLVIVAAAALSALSMWFFVMKTRRGLSIRAAVDRPALGRLRGVDVRFTARSAWVLAASLSTLAGVVAAPNPAFGLNSDNYTLALVVAATAAALARFRSLPVAFAGGVALGIAQNLVSGYLQPHVSIAGFSSSTPFWLLFIALILLGRSRARLTGIAAAEAPPRSATTDLPAWRRRLPWAVATVVLICFTLLVADPIWQTIVLQGLAVGIVFLSFTVISGMGGMISLAQATYALSGGLMCGMLVDRGVPVTAAIILGALFACALGVITVLPAIRLGGITLSMATLAVAYVCDRFVFQTGWLSNTPDGWTLGRPSIGPLTFDDDRAMAMLLLGVLLLVVLGVHNLKRSATGRAIFAVRASEPAAAASGVSSIRTKLALFALSSAIAGLGGGLFFASVGAVNPASWPPLIGLLWLTVVAIFGLRSPGGAVVAGLVMYASPRIINHGILFWHGTSSTLIPSILFGLGAVGFAQQPEGVLADFSDKLRARRDRRRVPGPASGEVVPTPSAPRAPAIDGSDSPPAPSVNGVAPMLQLRGVAAGYGAVEVLRDIDLDVPRGKIVAVIGANGAGKSTLCGVISGLIAPTAGSVHLAGQDLEGVPAHERAQRGLFVAPESRGIFPGLSVDDNLSLTLDQAADRQALYARFEHLDRRRTQRAGDLSGGEQQILTLAPALQKAPAILVADEPTLGLAPQIITELQGLFRELRDRGVTLLLSEEKARDVLPVADYVVVLELGRVAWSGPVDEMDAALVARAYVGA
jgi:ABC-type branched-subunit amino acid transport system ATPase component/branched-subunit amino acid ABC-type transport system permease component